MTEGCAASLEPVGSFAQPIFVSSDPVDPDRLFVVEREGTVRAVEGGDAGLLADLTGLVSCCAGSREPVSGVGTQITTASHSPSSPTSVVARRRPLSGASVASEMSSM